MDRRLWFLLGGFAAIACAGVLLARPSASRDAPRGYDWPAAEQRYIRPSQDIDPKLIQVEFAGSTRVQGSDGPCQEVRFIFTNRSSRPVGHVWIGWQVVGDPGGPTSESRKSDLIFAAETDADLIGPGQSFEMPEGTGKSLLERFLPPGPLQLNPFTIYCDSATNAEVDPIMLAEQERAAREAGR